jgi:hypothetical protein
MRKNKMKINVNIDKLTEQQAKEILKELIEKLDDMDTVDFFGTEGWRHMLGFED